MADADLQIDYKSLIQESEFLNAILESIDDGIVACNADGELNLFNKATREFHGLPEKTMPADELADYYGLFKADGVSKMTQEDIPLLRALRGEDVTNVELTIVPKEGQKRTVLCNGRQLKNADGQVMGAVVAMHDISKQRAAEVALEASQRRFESIFNSTFGFIGFLDIDGILLEANQTALDFGGLRAEEVLGRPFWEARWWSLDESSQETLKAAIKRAAGGEFVRYEANVRGSGDVTAFIDFSLRPVTSDAGDVVAIIPEGRDITKQKEAEDRLLRSQQQLERSQEVAKLGYWEWQPGSGELFWSKRLYELYNIDTAEKVDYARFIEAIHPEDRDRIHSVVGKALADKTSFEHTHRVLLPSGELRYIHGSGQIELDEHGNVANLLGTAMDVSRLTQAERSLSVATARFQSAFESAAVGMTIVSKDSTWLELNDAFCNVLGYSRENLLGESLQAITHPDDVPQVIELLDNLLSGAVLSTQFETRYIRSDDSIMHALVDVSSVYVDDKLEYFVGHVLDITETHEERKRKERSEKKFRAIFELQPSAIVYTDSKGRIIETNSSIDHLFGYAPRELIGRSIWVLYQRGIDYLDLVTRARKEAEGTLWQTEVTCLHKDGFEISCELTGRVVDEGERETHIWVFQDISERKRAQEKLEVLNQRLMRSREEERLHIAREIHDQSIQELIAVNYGLAALQRHHEIADVPALTNSVQHLRNDVVAAVKQLRGVISELRPAALEEFGFETALEGFISKLSRQHVQVPDVMLDVTSKSKDFAQPVLICLFRTAQEALNNMVKHAAATEARVTVQIIDDEVHMIIEDNGKGFDVPTDLEALKTKQHYGLAGIEERVKLMQGRLRVRSQSMLGTELSISLPLVSHKGEKDMPR